MPSSTCSVRVHLPRPLFRKLMARAILERTELSSLVIRAIRSEMPRETDRRRPRGKAVRKASRNA